VNGVTYVYDNNGNLLNDGVNAYTYDSANRLKTFTNATTTATYTYNGLGDRPSTGSGHRLQETVNGVTTTFTMDLNTGLTQALSDGTNHYIYGLGRIAQVNTTTEYFLGDALGSVRQLADTNGAITYARGYDPYGVVTTTSGASQSAYGYTGEAYGDSTELLYLRARHYASNTGRFLTRDPSGAETNLYRYVNANPINRIDPSGFFSKEVIEKNISMERFATSGGWRDHSKWGFYFLLRQAESGDTINSGYAKISNAAYASVPGPDTSTQVWSTPRTIRLVNCDKIMVGQQFLDEYFTNIVDRSWDRDLRWRDSTSVVYYLHRQGLTPKVIWDGYDNDMVDYPQFVGTAYGAALFEVGDLTDMDGNKYLSVSFGWGISLGVSLVEGYLCDWALNRWSCAPGMPSKADIEKAISGICAGPQLQLVYGFDLGTICKDMSFNNWNLTSSVLTFYFGSHVAGGVGGSVVIPLSWFGVSPNPNEGWRSLIDTRKYYGITWDSLALWR
jgi:RHS repeat-associated protein